MTTTTEKEAGKMAKNETNEQECRARAGAQGGDVMGDYMHRAAAAAMRLLGVLVFLAIFAGAFLA